MPLFIASLNSGSNGNCYYVGNDSEAVFIDVGLSCRETERRMRGLNLDMLKVKAIFISHEHSDHITGMAGLSKKWKIPVYITPQTFHRSGFPLLPEWMLRFRAYEPVHIGGLSIMPFPKYHDGCDPHSFTVSGDGVHIGVFTDIGRACEHLQKQFRRCHAAFLEANYDEVMLETGRYPYHLKKRISGGLGHLSNRQALEVFLEHRSPYISHLLLAHLSKENNNPQLVERLFREHAGDATVVVASRYQASEVYEIHAGQPEKEELPDRPEVQVSKKGQL